MNIFRRRFVPNMFVREQSTQDPSSPQTRSSFASLLNKSSFKNTFPARHDGHHEHCTSPSLRPCRDQRPRRWLDGTLPVLALPLVAEPT